MKNFSLILLSSIYLIGCVSVQEYQPVVDPRSISDQGQFTLDKYECENVVDQVDYTSAENQAALLGGIAGASTIVAGTSALDKSVSNFALENSLTGFEFLSCIPGTIGGGIRMNSGCYREDISKILLSVQVMDLDGKIKVIYASDINFSYRECNLDNNLIFVSATFLGKKSDKQYIQKKMNDLTKQKKNSQPSKIKTCGSTFKNPNNNKAWKLIKNSSCADMEVGHAHISQKHCNFFVNKGNAKSKDLEKLIYQVKKKVLEKTGINLELEIQIIGTKI